MQDGRWSQFAWEGDLPGPYHTGFFEDFRVYLGKNFFLKIFWAFCRIFATTLTFSRDRKFSRILILENGASGEDKLSKNFQKIFEGSSSPEAPFWGFGRRGQIWPLRPDPFRTPFWGLKFSKFHFWNFEGQFEARAEALGGVKNGPFWALGLKKRPLDPCGCKLGPRPGPRPRSGV